MRAVLGFIFLLGGFLVAYLVLSGKFPASASTGTVNGASGDFGPGTNPPPLPPAQSGNPHGGPGPAGTIQASNGGMRLPTMLALSHQASIGGMT